MNALNGSDKTAFKNAQFLAAGFDALRTHADRTAELRIAIKTLEDLGDSNTRRRAEKLSRQLDAFEPAVTLIGQIKSGKTSVVNALVGWPDLLPADVNPWTSVVTSLHLYPETPDFQNSASFRFFSEDEWDRLVSGGGRIGELASRAGAADELEKIKQQVAQMREKSRARLGRKFELMLGQQRDYGYFDQELIERYVCLGDAPDETMPGQDAQGRFADITKSADLSLQRTALPHRLCVRDTPGVNDTFMMREQITIRAIRDSRLCVVVLSAHQALSSTDLALIRLITHVRSRDVIIFVNRTDELSDSRAEIPQIRQSITDTLERHKGPADAEIIFGSALWASAALQDDLSILPAASAKALQNRSGSAEWPVGHDRSDMRDPTSAAWEMSGLPELQKAVADRLAAGPGAANLQRVAASGLNLLSGLTLAGQIGSGPSRNQPDPAFDFSGAAGELDRLAAVQRTALIAAFDDILASFSQRMERVQDSFLERATSSLVNHLDKLGETTPWTYDPTGLRVLLNASHKVLARNSAAAFDAAVKAAATDFRRVYASAFGLGEDDVPIALPQAPEVPPPIALGRTIALDLRGGWWTRWWKQRRGYSAYAASFAELIRQEISPIINELREDLAEGVRARAIDDFDAFVAEQKSVFTSVSGAEQPGTVPAAGLSREKQTSDTETDLQTARAIFEGFLTDEL